MIFSCTVWVLTGFTPIQNDFRVTGYHSSPSGAIFCTRMPSKESILTWEQSRKFSGIFLSFSQGGVHMDILGLHAVLKDLQLVRGSENENHKHHVNFARKLSTASSGEEKDHPHNIRKQNTIYDLARVRSCFK